MKTIHILYIDSDIETAGQLIKYFNPRLYETTTLPERDRKYRYIFIHRTDFEEGLEALKEHNIDPIASQRGLPLIDFIVFALPRRFNRLGADKKHAYLEFLEKTHYIGIERLQLWRGFWAIAYQYTDTLMRELCPFGIRDIISRPIAIIEFEIKLDKQMDLIEAASSLTVHTQAEKTLKTGEIVTPRFLRLNTQNGKTMSTTLPSIVTSLDPQGKTVWRYSYDRSKKRRNEQIPDSGTRLNEPAP